VVLVAGGGSVGVTEGVEMVVLLVGCGTVDETAVMVLLLLLVLVLVGGGSG
jgi:hypothetical protein